MSKEILLSEIGDLEEALEKREKQKNRHLLWVLLGISPAALIPVLGLLRSGAAELALLLIVIVLVVEIFRAGKAGVDCEKMRKELRVLRGELEGAPGFEEISSGREE